MEFTSGSAPHPEYVSGHSIFSGAASRMLALYIGTDSFEFTALSDSLPGVERRFHSFSSCAEEIGRSRIHGGIHFAFSNRDGIDTGRKIADYIFEHALRDNSIGNDSQ